MGLEIYPLPLISSEEFIDTYLLMERPVYTLEDITYSHYIKGAEVPILVDTGVAAGVYTEFGWKENPKPDWDLVKHLKKLSVKPEDVGYIIHTHLHMDHCGQDRLFPNAKIVVQRKELESAAVPRIPKGYTEKGRAWWMLAYDRRPVAELVGEFWDRLVLLEGDEEIVPGVKCVLVGGHTPGSQAVYVETDKGTAILTGDACYTYANIERDIPDGFYYNLEDSIKVLAKFRKDGKFIIPGHDRQILERFPVKIPP
jgi:glyoxylase-like metal-dependent hydrolase (beta-lactamase superfamily II)